VKVGDVIPDFTLIDQNREEFRLYDVLDKMVLLSFHPLAWTGVCAKQMQSLESNKEEFADLGVEAVGISVDSNATKKAWAKELDIEDTKLLADFWPHGDVAKMLGIFDEDKGTSKRTNVLIARNKEILWMKIYEMSTLPQLDEITEFIKKERRKGREI